MWNQWSAAPPPMPAPAPSAPAPQQPLIGPVLPTGPVPSNPAPPPTAAPPVVQQPSYPASSGAPTYTPAQYAAMTPEQQYAVQQHWQQWQAYEQQYAQWHAQYGEQYKREMAAIHGAPPAATYGNAVPQLPATNSYAYPPPAAANPYQAPPAVVQAPPPPPPDDSQTSMGVKAPPQIYDQPPPPPPPPQAEDSQQKNSGPPLPYQSGSAPQGPPAAQFPQQPENRWSQPPPAMQNQAGRWNDSGSASGPMGGSMGGQQSGQMGGPLGGPMCGPMGGPMGGQMGNQMGGQQSGSMGNQQQFNNNNNNNNQQGNQNQQNDKGRNRRGGRGRSRGGNNYENNNRQQEFDDSNGRNNRQQQFDDSNGRNNRQQQFNDSDGRNNRQSWGQTDNFTQGNNRGNFNNNRFDNYDNFNRNMGQNNGQQQSSGNWNNNNQGNSFSSPGNQRQQPFTQNQSTPVAQNSAKPVCDEKAFDEQFRLWEEQFENWKKENANHPDRTMYMQYEREFEKTRVRLLERREQMRRRKLMEQQQLMPQQPSQQPPEQQPPPQPPQTPLQNLAEPIQEESIPAADKNKGEEKQGDLSDMDQSEPEDTDQAAPAVEEEPSVVAEENAVDDKNTSSDGNIFQNTQITGIFTSGGGIPGLDLVESKEDGQTRELPERDPPDVIDLEADGPSRPAKFPAKSSSIPALFPPKPMQHPQMQQGQLQPDLGIRLLPPLAVSQPQQKKIPSLFDIVVEKPLLSPEAPMRNRSPERIPSPCASRSSKVDLTTDFGETRSRSISKDRDALASPGQRPLSQLSSMSQRQSFQNNPDASANNPFGNQSANLPPETADLAKALQDPNVMQLLTVALAQAQQSGGLNPANPQQQQLIQRLKHLQPLIQMQQQQQEQGFNNQQNQSWNNQQQQRQQSWKNQNSNFNSGGGNMNQNRNSWGGNPFQRNNDQFPSNRGPDSGNESDGNNDSMQSRNPRNPFRSGGGGGGGFGNDDNSGSNKNFGRDFGGPARNPFQDNDNCGPFNDGPNRNPFQGNDGGGPFGGNSGQGPSGGFGNQQQRGGDFGGNGRFDNNRNLSNFDTSLGFRNNQNPFGDRDNDYFRPTQVFDYQNRSRSDALVPPTKVVDYGHRPSAAMPINSFNRDTSEFVPVKTIDYGHASNSAQKESTGPQRSRWNQDPPIDQAKAQSGGQSQLSGQKVPQTQAPALEKKMNTESLPANPQNKSNSTQLKNQNNKNQKQTQQQVKGPLNKQEKKTPQQEVKEKKDAAQQKATVDELDGENLSEYPNNKWILQNPESRQRPGPPTKRGKRNSGSRQLENNEEDTQNNEGDEIEENFEEISDAEDLNNESAEASHQKSPFKAKSQPLFPSVSDTIVNTPVVFPSMENNNTIPIDEILFKPGRLSRPKNIVIIIRGPPGSGKSHVAKLIKDKEVEMGGPTPRLLSIDDYFMVENDYEEKCPKTGRKIPKKEILYEYEKDMETTYMQYLIKSFKKTIADHLFEMIIVDCCNQSLRTFNEFYNAARDGNFSPFVVDLICDAETCMNQNIHNRKEAEIREIIKNYQDCPGHYIKLDVTNLLENVVEMEDVSDLEDNFVADSEVIELDDDDEPNDENENDNDNDDDGGFLKSKWDTDPTTENLARLDGTSKPISKRGTATLEEYLQIDGWEPPTSNTNGKKRVRWADIEEKRAQDKMRAIGFVVGQTDWNRMMDPTSGSGALTKTKYIERVNKRR